MTSLDESFALRHIAADTLPATGPVFQRTQALNNTNTIENVNTGLIANNHSFDERHVVMAFSLKDARFD